MSNYDVIAPVQSYNIHRTEYSVKYGSEKDISSAEIKTLVGTIIQADGYTDEQFNNENKSYSGYQYRYHILSHHKKLSNHLPPEQLLNEEQSKTETQLQTEENYAEEFITRNSLLYVTYSNDKYEEYDRVFVKRENGFLIINGRPAGAKKSIIVDGEATIGELCKINISYNSDKLDENGNVLEPSAQKVSPTVTSNIDTTEAKEIKSTSKYAIKVAEGCTDTFIESVVKNTDAIVKKIQEDPEIKIFEAYEQTPNGDVRKAIYGKTLSRGKKYFDGSLIVSPEIVEVNLPLYMLSDLKKMASKFYTEFGQPLEILSGFRTHQHQGRLRARYLDYMTNPSKYNYPVPAAAAPGKSKHNFASAVDFKINILDKDVWTRNTSFTYEHYKNGDWPKAFKWLKENAAEYKFEWPKWAQGSKNFEGWHFDYKGTKSTKGVA